MSRHQHLAVCFCLAFAWAALSRAADLQEIVSRGIETLQSDWAADQKYAFVEKDEVLRDGRMTGKTSQVVFIDGSDYYLPLAFDDQPLPPDRENAEVGKMKEEVQRRNTETPEARRERIARYKSQRGENEALVMEFPHAFTFELLREDTMNGDPVYVLAGTPRKRPGPLSLAAKVLSGMRGTVWLDKESYHAVRVECEVVKPVPVYGILARVLPGTHIEFGMAPVTDRTWLIGKISMKLTVSKLFFFKSTQVTRSTYTDYRLNTLVLDELLNPR